jgi:membrane fusion protein (multidrug efflux system)
MTSTTDAAPPPVKKRSSVVPRIILIVCAILLIGGGLYYYLSTRGRVTTDDAYTDGRAVSIASRISGYVVQLSIADNQRVKAGDVLLKLDPRDYETARQKAVASLALAQAQQHEAEANLVIARTTYPARLVVAEAQKRSSEASSSRARADFDRQLQVDARATTQQQIDAAKESARTATASLTLQDAQVKIASLVDENIAVAQAAVSQRMADVAQAEADLAQAELNLSYTVVTAPQDGWVTKRNVELGTYLQAGQSILSLVSPDVWVTANFKESQLTALRPGQSVAIAIDAYPQLQLVGHVDSVQMGTGSRFTTFPPENATGNYVKIVQRVPVKIIIDKGLDPNLPLPLGLSVDPVVTVR